VAVVVALDVGDVLALVVKLELVVRELVMVALAV
jgi:hypothetical protein